MRKKLYFLFAILLLFCNGCSASIAELKKSVWKSSFDGNVKLVKEDITVTKTDYMKYGPYAKQYQNYEITVPYQIEGEVKKEIKDMPVRFFMDMELGQAVTEMSIHAEQDTLYKVMKSSFTIEKGAQDGSIILKTDYNAMAMQGEPDTYPYIWIAIQLEDDDNADDYVLISNPYYQNDCGQVETKGDLWIDQESIELEKGEMKDGVQHYNLSFLIDGQDIDDVTDQEIPVGMDFFLACDTFEDDVGSGYIGAFCFQEGEVFGVSRKTKLDNVQKKTEVTLDVYNRFVDDIIGQDIDYYPYFWVALAAKDRNKNNNYYTYSTQKRHYI